MTNRIGHAEFESRYGAFVNAVSFFQPTGEIVLRSDGWQKKVFDFDLWGFVEIPANFQALLSFVERPANFDLVIAEVESVKRYTEAFQIVCDFTLVRQVVEQSTLPHFRTICFDRTCTWVALFDNDLGQTVATRLRID